MSTARFGKTRKGAYNEHIKYNENTMKKTHISQFVIALVLALSFQSMALAAYSPSDALADFNTWLQTDMKGIEHINNSLKKTKAAAHEQWNDRAALYDFTLTYSQADSVNCEFKLSSYETDENDYMGVCTADGDPETSLTENNPDVKYHIYRVDLLLRDLVPAIIADERTLPLLESLYGPDANIALSFNLSKNNTNQLFWTVTFMDEQSGATYLVKTRADLEDEIPSFIVLSKNS